jgi:hypothetical protein
MPMLARRVRVALGAFVLVASSVTCDKESVSPSQSAPVPGAAAPQMIDEKVSVELGLAVDDALTRIVPTLGDAEAVKPLVATLAQVRAALAARELPAIKAAQTDLRASLDAFPAADHAEVIQDIAAIRLLVDQLDLVAATPPPIQ